MTVQARPGRPLHPLWAVGTAVPLLVLAQPPHDLWPLAFLGVAPLAACADGTSAVRSFAVGWLSVFVAGLVVGRDLLHALGVEYAVPWPAAFAVTLLVIGSAAVLPGAALAAYARLRLRVHALAAPFLFTALYLASEWLRALPLPWVMLGQPLAGAPLWLQVADLGGVHAVALAPALLGAGLGIGFARRRPGVLAGPAVALACVAVYGALRLASPQDGGPGDRGPGMAVGVVQAAVPQRERFVPGSALRNTLHHAALTRELVRQHAPELVIWSETAVDEDLDRNPSLRALLERLVAETGVPLLFGAPRSAGGTPVNATLLLLPGGGEQSYAKQRLVPFSEGEPPALLRPLAPLLAPLVEGAPYQPGPGPVLLRGAGPALATPICFEITYPGLAREFRAAGAELLVNLSNDAWFGEGPYAVMHFRHALLRAVELRSYVVRAANTGISGVIDPHGRVVAQLGVGEEGSFVARVRATRAMTFYARFGDGPLLALLASLGSGALRVSRRAQAGRA